MLKTNYLRNKKHGFTLIELLIVIAILGLVLSILFSMNLFGIKTFKKGSDRSQNQYAVRMAADFITKQLRYAESVQIVNVPTPAAGKSILYLENNSGKTEILYNKNGAQVTVPGVSSVADYKLSFTKVTDKIIRFTVGKAGTNAYDIESEVTVLNASSSSPITVHSSDNEGVAFTLSEPISDSDAVAADRAWLNIQNTSSVISNITLPNAGPNGTTITWSSNNISTVSNIGIVTQSTDSDVTVILTAAIKKGSITQTKDFTLIVKKTGTGLTIVSVANVNASIALGLTFTMPNTVVATMSDNSLSDVNAIWSPSNIDTSTVGTKTSEGTISGYSPKITLTVNVVDKALCISNVFASKNVPRKTYFSYTFIASGGTEPYVFTYTNLPAWLIPSNETISGTPGASETGENNITLKVTDSAGSTKSYPVTITVVK